MEEIEKFVLSMEEKVTELDAQMQEQVQALNAKMDAIKALIKEKKIDIDNAKNGLEGRIWRVGDVLLSDGTIINADDVEDMDEADREKAEGVVCAVKKEGKSAYMLCAKHAFFEDFSMGGFSKSPEEFDSEVFAEDLEKYKTGWKIPTIKLLENIAKNIEAVNEVLMTLGSSTIKDDKYLSINRDDKGGYQYYRAFHFGDNAYDCRERFGPMIPVYEL